jgi:hypothetical protein
MKFFKPLKHQDCGTEVNWVSVHEGCVYFRPDLEKVHPETSCSLVAIKRVNDKISKLGARVKQFENGHKILSDSFFVDCRDKYQNSFKTVLASVKREEAKVAKWKMALQTDEGLKLPRQNPDVRPPDVIMIGLDSMSHNAWKRYLPKTYKHLTASLGAVTLNGYNIVGDATLAALLPMLTGLTEYELAETDRDYLGVGRAVDDFPWIWRKFSERGYATAYIEDQPWINTFNHRLFGFKNQPTDVYGRTHFLAVETNKDRILRKNPWCDAGQHRYKANFLDVLREHFRVYTDIPKFIFTLSNEFSHG